MDYAPLVKIYGQSPKRFSPAECIGARPYHIEGSPDPAHLSTSYAERQDLSMRMHMRRFTRLTNASSKRFQNHVHALAIYFVFYNFVRIHKTLRVTPRDGRWRDGPALWSMEDIAELVETGAPKPGRRGPFKQGTSPV